MSDEEPKVEVEIVYRHGGWSKERGYWTGSPWGNVTLCHSGGYRYRLFWRFEKACYTGDTPDDLIPIVGWLHWRKKCPKAKEDEQSTAGS